MPDTAILPRLLPTLLVALLLAGCASGPPKPVVDFKQDYDFSGVREIAFYAGSGQVTGSNPLQLSDIQRDRANRALQQALEKRGYVFVDDPAEADLLLSWHLLTEHKTDVRTYQTPAMGYPTYGPYNRYSRYNCWSCMPTQTEVRVLDYTEGTFIVDMIDPTLEKSVWRGVTQSRLKPDSKPDQANYNAAADAIFLGFPPN